VDFSIVDGRAGVTCFDEAAEVPLDRMRRRMEDRVQVSGARGSHLVVVVSGLGGMTGHVSLRTGLREELA